MRIARRVQPKDGVDYVSWRVEWREDGKLRSTSRSNKEEANALASEIATRLAKGEIKQRILTGLELAQYEQCLDMMKEAGDTLLEAVRFYSREWKKRQVREIMVPDLVEEFLQAKKQIELSKRYQDDARLRLKKFSKAFKGAVGNITSREIDDFLRDLPVSLRSKDNVHIILKSIFSYARSRGYLPSSERTAAEILPRIKFKPVKIGILTPTEFSDVLRQACKKTLPAFVLGGFCGMRQAEICRLEWSAIDFTRKLITVNADIAKTSRRRLVPLHAAAAAWISPVSKEKGRIIEYSGPVNLSIMMRNAYQRARVKHTQNCLRHSAASYRLAITNNAPQTALELGTSIEMLMRNYRELVSREEAEKWCAIYPPIDSPSEGDPGNPIDGEISETVHPPQTIQMKLDESNHTPANQKI